MIRLQFHVRWNHFAFLTFILTYVSIIKGLQIFQTCNRPWFQSYHWYNFIASNGFLGEARRSINEIAIEMLNLIIQNINLLPIGARHYRPGEITRICIVSRLSLLLAIMEIRRIHARARYYPRDNKEYRREKDSYRGSDVPRDNPWKSSGNATTARCSMRLMLWQNEHVCYVYYFCLEINNKYQYAFS